jgi:DNA topoisomerase I
MAPQWILRKGSKARGFRYVRESGAPVGDRKVLARIEALRVPPGWTDVHVAASSRAAVQAWGFDAKGRKQYRYHDRAIERGELRKYYRVREMARDLPTIRAAVRRDFRGREPSRQKVTAGVVRLISEAFFRTGGERYAKENKTFGITTMRKKHVQVEKGTISFEYVGKESVRQRQVVVDAQLARFVAQLLRTPGPRLFRHRDEEGVWRDLSARDVNDYLHRLVGVPYTAKDFRTWGGTLRAATILAELGPAASAREAKKNVVTTVRLVAAELGNTPTVCRGSYIHPMVIARYLDDGETIAADLPRRWIPRRRPSHAPEELALIKFLDRNFPERRRRPRTAQPAHPAA